MLPSDNVSAPAAMDRDRGKDRLRESQPVTHDNPARTVMAFTTRQQVRLIAVQVADILALDTNDTPQAVLEALANAHEQLIAALTIYRAHDGHLDTPVPYWPADQGPILVKPALGGPLPRPTRGGPR